MSEEQGQAQEQPTMQDSLAMAERIIDAEENPKEETPPTEQPAEQPTEQPAEEAEEGGIELDLDAKLFEVEEVREGGTKEKVKYSLNELKAQRMMQADYQRKTAELAREREAVKERIKQETEPVVKQFQDKLQLYENAVWQAMAPELQGVDMDKLASENPAEWARKMQVAARFNTTLQAIQMEKERLAQYQQSQTQEEQQKQIARARETLQRDIPGWNEEVYRSVLKTGLEYDYSAEEVNAVTDPRAIKVLHDAMKYRALQAAKPAMEKKVVNVPKVVKPGSAEKPDPNRESLAKAKAQLKKTGSKEDAIAVAMHLVQ